MSAQPLSQARTSRRRKLSDQIVAEGSANMPECNRCKKAGATCVIAPEIHSSCSRCIKSGHRCDIFMSHTEFDTLSARIGALRGRRKDLKRQLVEMAREKQELEKRRGDIVRREIESLESWDNIDSQQKMLLATLPPNEALRSDLFAIPEEWQPNQSTGCQSGSGIVAGLNAGNNAGLDAGLDAGLNAGLNAGLDAGFNAGIDIGLGAGLGKMG